MQQAETLLSKSLKSYKETTIKPRSFDDVFRSPCIPIARIEREIAGRDRLSRALYEMFTEFFNDWAVEETINASQIYVLVTDIIDDDLLRHLSIEDFILFFKMARKNSFGNPYGKLSEHKIFDWLMKFFDLRCEMARKESEKNDEKYKELSPYEGAAGVTYQHYLNLLKQSQKGDKKAAEQLRKPQQ